MHDSMKRKVLELLENYPINQRKIAVLRYELEHPTQISPEEMIDAMSFGHGDGQGPTPGHISNKTLYIALNYQEKTDEANQETANAIAAQLWELEREQHRLEYYVSLLEEHLAEMIRLRYFEGNALPSIAKMKGISLKTVYRHYDRAIHELAGMYELFMDQANDKTVSVL